MTTDSIDIKKVIKKTEKFYAHKFDEMDEFLESMQIIKTHKEKEITYLHIY